MPKLPSNLFFLNCSQCRRWPKVPLDFFFSKNRSPYPRLAPLSRLWPFFKALALLQGFHFCFLIAFSGYFNPTTFFLFHLRCSLWLRPSFILSLAPLFQATPLPLPGGGEGLDCPLLELLVLLLCWFCSFSRPFVCHLPRPFF